MNPGRLRLALLPLLALAGTAVARADDRTGSAAWWIEKYGVVGTDEEQVAGARRVFERLRAVSSGPAAAPTPRLLVLRRGPALALAIPDGHVVLSRAGVALAYEGVDAATGDARLALVLGHELAHLTDHDFWRSFAKAVPAPRTGVTRGEARSREDRADVVGFLYALVAGYPADDVLAHNASFLARWSGGRAGGSAAHLAARARQRLFQGQLEALEERLDAFRFGVRLYQLGRHADAIQLLQTFKERLPRREVLLALGLCHYQLALQALAACGEPVALRFRLPTRLDTQILLRRRVTRGSVPCVDTEAFKSAAGEGVGLFEQALRDDPAYLPASVNLSSLFILMVKEPRAIDVIEEGVTHNRDRALAINHAVAQFSYGQRTHVSALAEEGLKQMRLLADSAPRDPLAAFNLAVMQSESVRDAQAHDAWERYLALEPQGPYAARARVVLSLPPADARATPAPPPSPVPLGDVRNARPHLDGFRRQPLATMGLKATVYRKPGLAALELNGGIEVVEEDLKPPLALGDVIARFGPPADRIETTLGTTLVFDGFALDVEGDVAVRRAHFAPALPPVPAAVPEKAEARDDASGK